ncbi:Endonuclease/exonuclease/phosphatase [Radiomyces spectabilis]|uniref:Endonuclease/exonuclease/phosphatase n=1 Tax=Radiomyces spectabilis TaxID=64574 RepID=UPI00222011DF|nr:Endonuclease/exonuclease/phosphatase [Radiomyces spectabilis]KAI8364663.1 Endonuclease/exonuclease/phosphatase [Radiomyces spectabilis]
MNSCQCIYSIDPSAPNDAGDKVRALMFAPAPNVADDGRHLWVGMQDGVIMVLDSITGAILGKRTTSHSHAICFILRYRNTEMWTLDESGILNMWPVLTVDCERNHPLEMTPQKHMVAARTVAALIVGTSLWTSSGRTLDVFHFAHHGSDSPHIRIPNDVGNITQLVTVPYHKKLVFASHDDGKITVWDTETVEKVQVITISMYGICSMAAAGEFYLWTGYNTGMIYVYDTRPEKWVAVKIWKAHNTAVTTLMVDESGFSRDEKSMQVISADSNGCVATWDGLLTETWQDAQLEKHVRDYCSYRNVRVAICSWNIDANKPEKLVGNDNDKIYEWLGQMDDPDIIVVGIQEIVDLESKKQTARSLFASRKKIETLQEAEELLTHRYRLWHDHLVRVIGDNYGANAYTVIKTDQLVGLFSCVFVKTSEVNRVINCDSTLVKTGMKLMNKSLHGNKGGIAIRFLFDHSSLCFINCHLAAGQSHSQQRNADAEGILQTATFPELRDYCDVFAHGGDGTLVLDHEHCFLSGDLNYRINMTREKVLQLLASHDKEKAWRTLQQKDQLLMQRITNPLFKLLTFQEAPIQFDPTYKYDPGTDFYDRSEKKRIPAWCDRVLYRSRHAQNLYYQRHEVRASDHRPISAGFVIQTKIIDGEKRDQLMDKIEMVWQDSLERLVRDKKAQYVADYELCNLQEARQLLETKHWDVQEVVMNLRSAN